MRRMPLLILAALMTATSAPAKKIDSPDRRANLQYRSTHPHLTGNDVSFEARRASGDPSALAAAPDTTFLAEFTFDVFGTCDEASWTSVDITAREPNMWHVDDFAGLSSQPWQVALHPLQGSKSFWCGARPDANDMALCQYAVLPGYGNNWYQPLCTKSCLDVDVGVSINYMAFWDSEPGYDQTRVEVDRCDDDWTTLPVYFYDYYDGTDSVITSTLVPDSLHEGQLRVRFSFTSDGAFSDQDGLWDTNGAFVLDSVSVTDASGIVVPLETFEDEPVGATEADDWAFCRPSGYGDFAALFPAITLVQEDPCASNISCVWGFFSASTANYGCGGFPAQPAVPYGKVNDPSATWWGRYINNEIWSPMIPWTGTGTSAFLEFDVYRDLKLDDGVFYLWHVRSFVGGTCPSRWEDRNTVYWGAEKQWLRERFEFGDLVEPGATHIQVALTCVDMCPFWCGVFVTGDCHSHAPLFDNVKVYRVDVEGPRWSVDDVDLFQDSFPGDGTTTGTVRADAARTMETYAVFPQDYARVTVADPEVGLAADPYTGFGAAVYAYVGVWPQNQPGKTGDALTDDGRWPVVDSLDHDGDRWYCVRVDTVFTGPGRQFPKFGEFCVDLNDDLFTPGDTVCFFFCATSDTPSTVTTYWSEFTGTTTNLTEVLDNPMEFTCLPAGGWLRGGDILYVDVADGLGVQPYFDQAFASVLEEVDRFDIRDAAASQGNRPAHHVKNIQNQLLDCYRYIIWSSGTLSQRTVTDTYSQPEFVDDAAMLVAFLDGLDNPGGVYFSGDDIADELSTLTGPSAIDLRSRYISYGLTDGDHVAQGLGVNPSVIGESSGCFHHAGGPDEFYAYAGCPGVTRDFDVMIPTGQATLEAFYSGGGTAGGAIIGQRTLNPDSTAVGVLLSGFSFDAIRDDQEDGILDRWHHMRDILTWLGKTVPIPVAAGDTPGRNRLAQNYPNPFNPTTTITFELRETARVRVAVYNIAGQLVKVLADDVREGGVAHTLVWDGRSDAGTAVASGVYFYRIVAPGFTRTRKMVLLK